MQANGIHQLPSNPYAGALRRSPAPGQQPPAPPQDQAILSNPPGGNEPPNNPKPTKEGKPMWAKVAIGVGLTSAALGGIHGGITAWQNMQNAPAVENVQVLETQQQTAPRSILQNDYQPLTFETARINATPTVRDFGSLQGQLSIERHTEPSQKQNSDGQLIEHQFEYDALVSNGNAVYRSEVAQNIQMDFAAEGEENWNTYSHLKPAGQAGKYISVLTTDGGYSGGASSNKAHQLVTLDTRTGDRVTLDQIMEPGDFDELVGRVSSGLRNHVSGQHYAGSTDEVRDIVNHSFALFQKDGKTKVSVMLPNVHGAAEGQVAEFTFTLPSSVLQ